jgi:hypothetical protein
MTIKNLTKKPLSVPLPGGKRLFLGPGKSGEINAKAAHHPPIVALVEAGEIEIIGQDGGFSGGGKKGGSPGSSGSGHSPDKKVFRSGDG